MNLQEILERTAEEHGDPKFISELHALQKGMAVIIAEHEVMRARLIELEEVYPEIPIRWRASGKTIVNIEETIAQFLRENTNAGAINRSNDGGTPQG